MQDWGWGEMGGGIPSPRELLQDVQQGEEAAGAGSTSMISSGSLVSLLAASGQPGTVPERMSDNGVMGYLELVPRSSGHAQIVELLQPEQHQRGHGQQFQLQPGHGQHPQEAAVQAQAEVWKQIVAEQAASGAGAGGAGGGAAASFPSASLRPTSSMSIGNGAEDGFLEDVPEGDGEGVDEGFDTPPMTPSSVKTLPTGSGEGHATTALALLGAGKPGARVKRTLSGPVTISVSRAGSAVVRSPMAGTPGGAAALLGADTSSDAGGIHAASAPGGGGSANPSTPRSIRSASFAGAPGSRLYPGPGQQARFARAAYASSSHHPPYAALHVSGREQLLLALWGLCHRDLQAKLR